MPRGTTHEVVGRLNERDYRWSLRVDDGGVWPLDLGWRCARRARGLAGARVRVEGVRDGHDLLAVTRLDAIEG